ncbi:MAG: glycosyltransferase family 1 protein [bacterium]
MPEATTTPYRIALDARFFRKETAGLGRYTRELIHHLAALDHFNQYTVFLTPADMLEWDLNQDNFQPVVIPITHYSLAEQTKLYVALQKGHFDLVHFLNFNHPLLYRRPFVTTLHDLTVYLYPVGRSQKSRLRRLAFVHTLKRSLKAASKVIAVSENSAADAEKLLGISHAKMEVIYHGGPDPVSHGGGSKGAVQSYLGTKDPYFLFVSQWRPHKGILTLIEAFNDFKKRTGLPHKLVLLGKKKALEEEVQKALEASPYFTDIVTPGFAPDELLPGIYHFSEAYIMPSEYEGFGLMILEAYNFGAPVITAENSSLPEVAGKGALYFPTRDAKKLADRMEQLVSTPGLPDQLREKGEAQMKKFSWEKTARHTLNVYLSVLEKRR